MIITLALNPGIEKYINIEKYEVGGTLPVKDYRLRIASSGIYSAYIMRLLQAEPYVLGFAGGIGGKYIKNFLDKNRIKSNLVNKEQELRTTIYITNGQGITTKLVDDEEDFDDNDGRNLKHRLVGQLDSTELVFISGSIRHDGSRDIIHKAVDNIEAAHKRLLLSLEGWDVLEFIQRSPTAIILDEKQVEILTQKTERLEDTLEQLREIGIENRVRYIFFYTADQVVGITKKKISYGTINGEASNSLGWSKDAVAGAMAIGIKRGYEFEKIIKLMTSVAYSISEEEYPVLCSRKKIDVHKKKVRVYDYYNNGRYLLGDL